MLPKPLALTFDVQIEGRAGAIPLDVAGPAGVAAPGQSADLLQGQRLLPQDNTCHRIVFQDATTLHQNCTTITYLFLVKEIKNYIHIVSNIFTIKV